MNRGGARHHTWRWRNLNRPKSRPVTKLVCHYSLALLERNDILPLLVIKIQKPWWNINSGPQIIILGFGVGGSMAAAVSVVSSSIIDSRTCPCWCLDAAGVPLNGGGDSFLQRQSIGRKHVPRLSSSFLDPWSVKVLWGAKNLRKQRKSRGLVVVGELAGQYEDNFEDIKKQILDYFTYKAVRTVLYQLYEMNPTQYRWFYNYLASNEHGFGKSFIRNLVKDKQDLAERVMVTRLHLYGKWIKKCDHTEMYERISDQNLELMRERLMETVIWPSDDSNTSVLG